MSSDGPFLWHRALLAACSPFLKELLLEPDSVMLLRDFPRDLVARYRIEGHSPLVPSLGWVVA